MENSKHTPGPWTVGHFGDVRGADGYHSLASVSSHSELPAQANARLIAAAPELLAALQSLMDKLSAKLPALQYHDCMEQYQEARAAIAKAQG